MQVAVAVAHVQVAVAYMQVAVAVAHVQLAAAVAHLPPQVGCVQLLEPCQDPRQAGQLRI